MLLTVQKIVMFLTAVTIQKVVMFLTAVTLQKIGMLLTAVTLQKIGMLLTAVTLQKIVKSQEMRCLVVQEGLLLLRPRPRTRAEGRPPCTALQRTPRAPQEMEMLQLKGLLQEQIAMLQEWLQEMEMLKLMEMLQEQIAMLQEWLQKEWRQNVLLQLLLQ